MMTCQKFKEVPTQRGMERRCASFVRSEDVPSGQDTSMHRSGYGAAATFSFPKLAGKVNTTDVAVGAGIGLLVTLGVKWGVNKWLVTRLPSWALQAIPVITSGVTAGVLYYAQQGKNPERARAHAVSALVVGGGVNAWDFVKSKFPGFSDLVAVEVPGYGYYVNDPTGATFPQLNGYGGMYLPANTGYQTQAAPQQFYGYGADMTGNPVADMYAH